MYADARRPSGPLVCLCESCVIVSVISCSVVRVISVSNAISLGSVVGANSISCSLVIVGCVFVLKSV